MNATQSMLVASLGACLLTVLALGATLAEGGRRWRSPLNLFTLAITLLPIGLLVPNLFLNRGRTETQCAWLHHGASTASILAMWTTRLYFLQRSNQVVASRLQERVGRLLVVLVGAATLINLLVVHLTIRTVVAADGICLAVLDPIWSIWTGLVLPYLAQVIINARFVGLLLSGTDAVRGHWRLCQLCCVTSLVDLVVNVVMNLPVRGAIPVANPSLIVALISVNSTVNACSVAWPTIVVGLGRYGSRRRRLQVAPHHPIVPSHQWQPAPTMASTAFELSRLGPG